MQYVCSITSNMRLYAIEDALCAEYYQTNFDPDLVDQLLNYIKPESMKVFYSEINAEFRNISLYHRISSISRLEHL